MEFHRAASQPPVTGQAMRTGFRFRVKAGAADDNGEPGICPKSRPLGLPRLRSSLGGDQFADLSRSLVAGP